MQCGMKDVSTHLRQVCLPNGVRVVVCPMPHIGRAHVSVVFRGGPVHESDATWGLSHLLEHMVFRGSQKRPGSRAISLAADAFGGEIDGATYRDRVVFDTRVDPESIEDALDVLDDMLFEPAFHDLHIEREIVREELLELFDDDGQEIDLENVALRRLFNGELLARTIDGTLAGLEQADEAALRAFHASAYTPNNAVVAVTGPVDVEHVMGAVMRTFGRRARGPGVPRGQAPRKRAFRRRTVGIPADESQTTIRFAFRTPGLTGENRFAYVLLARLLDDGPAARFPSRLIDRDGLAYSLWASTTMFAEAGVFEVEAQVQHAKVERAAGALAAELANVWLEPPEPAELSRLLGRLHRQVRDLWDEPEAMADMLAKCVAFDVPVAPCVIAELAARVTPDMIARAARDTFRPGAGTIVLYGRNSARTLAAVDKAVDRAFM